MPKTPRRQSTTEPQPAPPYLEFSRRVRRWFRAHGRDLPWRRTRDPYHILVSELMLQQTQVVRVVPKYAEFLRRFPTLEAISAAPPSRVVSAWSGLGYYARARNLHSLARVVCEGGHGGAMGEMPSEPAALRRLPGVGAYTAGAVASFAFERRAALVDTNVARVLRRVFAPDADPRTTPGNKRLWAIAEAALPRTGRAAWAHNQGVMELGARLCTARVRDCDACPARSICLTHAADEPAEGRPRRPARG